LDRATSATDWRLRPVKRTEVLAGMARSLLLTDQSDLLSRFVAHVLAAPKIYSLTTMHLPALEKLQPWLKKNVHKRSPVLTRWLGACREQLEVLTAHAPQEPADFRRPAEITCKCADCTEL